MRRGQVWIETVLYTLIGLALIGLVLAFATPKINESKDRLAVEQAIESLNALDEKITAVSAAPGNVRIVEFTLRRGDLTFDAPNNDIILELFDLSKPYSEAGQEIQSGRVNILTTEEQGRNNVRLRIDYGQLDLQFAKEDTLRKFNPASVPYRFSVESTGISTVSIGEIGA